MHPSASLIVNAQTIRARLRRPPNAVPDTPIDLKRMPKGFEFVERKPLEKPVQIIKSPVVDKTEGVLDAVLELTKQYREVDLERLGHSAELVSGTSKQSPMVRTTAPSHSDLDPIARDATQPLSPSNSAKPTYLSSKATTNTSSSMFSPARISKRLNSVTESMMSPIVNSMMSMRSSRRRPTVDLSTAPYPSDARIRSVSIQQQQRKAEDNSFDGWGEGGSASGAGRLRTPSRVSLVFANE